MISLKNILVAAAVAWFVLAALVYSYDSIATVLRLAPHALYADQWRQYLDYVTLPFPQNIFHPDNGHRLVLPNVVAWLEIQWFAGNQWLQIGVGLCCGVAASAIAAGLCLRDASVPFVHRAAALFLCFFAIFWLANVRTLFHSTELLHTKLPMLCLVAAIALGIRAARRENLSSALVAALLLALGATFSFGYGLCVFLGIFAVLVACKANHRLIIACIVGLLFAAGLYLALPGSDGVKGSMTFAPLENLLTGARWLGAPFVTMLSYLWDPQATWLVPTDTLHRVTFRVATMAAAHLPDLHTSTLPQAAFGAIGMIALIVASLRRLRARAPAGPMEALGLGIAWFGLAAAGIISLSRLAYFHEHPEQIYADRYLCWPCLFWLGLALVALASRSRTPSATTINATQPRFFIAKTTFVCALLTPLLAWPTQCGGGIYAAFVRSHIDNLANASIVGVFARGGNTGETDPEEFVRGIPAISSRHLAQFATRAAALIGQPLPASVPLIDGAAIESQAIPDNLLGVAPGTAVTLRLQDSPAQVLLIDANNRVVGLASRDSRLQPPGYSGYARGTLGADDLRVAAVP